jgi:hypothetical protein
VTQTPSSASVISGSLVAGTAGSLGADDGSYYEVTSTGFLWLSQAPAFSASFTGVPSTASNLGVAHDGRGSTTCTLTLSIWNFSSSSWTTLGQQSIGSASDSLFTPPVVAGAAGSYRSSSGEVRVQARCSASTFGSYRLRSDRLTLTYSG